MQHLLILPYFQSLRLVKFIISILYSLFSIFYVLFFGSFVIFMTFILFKLIYPLRHFEVIFHYKSLSSIGLSRIFLLLIYLISHNFDKITFCIFKYFHLLMYCFSFILTLLCSGLSRTYLHRGFYFVFNGRHWQLDA